MRVLRYRVVGLDGEKRHASWDRSSPRYPMCGYGWRPHFKWQRGEVTCKNCLRELAEAVEPVEVVRDDWPKEGR